MCSGFAFVDTRFSYLPTLESYHTCIFRRYNAHDASNILHICPSTTSACRRVTHARASPCMRCPTNPPGSRSPLWWCTLANPMYTPIVAVYFREPNYLVVYIRKHAMYTTIMVVYIHKSPNVHPHYGGVLSRNQCTPPLWWCTFAGPMYTTIMGIWFCNAISCCHSASVASVAQRVLS